MQALEKVDWEILNATADDAENLEQIYLQVCFEFLVPSDDGKMSHGYRPIPAAPLLSEIANHIHSLVERGLLTAVADEEGRSCSDLSDLSYIWRAWFRMTPAGKRDWESSEHLIEHG